ERIDLRLELPDALPGAAEVALGGREAFARDRLGAQVTAQYPALGPVARDAYPAVAGVLVLLEELHACSGTQVPDDPVLEAGPRPECDRDVVGDVTRLAESGHRREQQADEREALQRHFRLE